MADFDLIPKTAAIAADDKPTEIFRAVYKRRGSELYISATQDAKVLVTRFRTRANKYEYWMHDHSFIEANSDAVKKWLESE